MQTRSITQFILAALLVSIIGGFAGWYFYIQNRIDDTAAADKARGGGDPAFKGDIGSTYQNIIADITGSSTAAIGKRAPRLWQIVRSPVAGFGFEAGAGRVYLAERATGNILKADPETSSIVRITNTLFPKVREAVFSGAGSVMLRTVDDANSIATFGGSIGTSSDPSGSAYALVGTYLPRDIVAITPVPRSDKVFFVAKDGAGGSVAVTADWKGTQVKKVYASPLSQWNIQALAADRYLMFQKASDGIPGSAFIARGGTITPLMRDVSGLTVTHHPTQDAFLFSASEADTVRLYAKIGAGKPVDLNMQTVAEKCAWAPGTGLIAYCAVPVDPPGAAFMERWYQGAVHTADVWWKIEAHTGQTSRFFVPDSSVALDVIRPQIDDAGSQIGFQNNADQSLWLLRVAE